MLVLSAPHNNDPRGDGFNHCLAGELLVRGTVCDAGRRGDHCGCERSWAGITSSRGTTIAVVRDQAISEDTYRALIVDHLIGDGWDHDDAHDEARLLADLAADHPAGTLVALDLADDGESHRFSAQAPDHG